MFLRIFFRITTIMILALIAVTGNCVAILSLGQTSAVAKSTVAIPSFYQSSSTSTVTLEDFTDIVTIVDQGFNDFSGNMGALNENYVSQMTWQCPDAQSCGLQFAWDFKSDGEGAFTGLFLSLFGLTDTETTFVENRITETVVFAEHFLNLDQIDGLLNEPGGSRSFQKICTLLTYQGSEDLELRFELQDNQNGRRFWRSDIISSPGPKKYCWDFRNDSDGDMNFDLQKAKVFSLIIERLHIADGVDNPVTGQIDIHHIWFVANWDEPQPTSDDELLDLLERRTYQYFLDWSSRKPESLDIPQDRSTFGDLLTVGGIGFALPAHIIAAERGWISRSEAATRALNVLKVLNDEDAFCSNAVGCIGYRGWFYHFLGINGRRKLNFDFPDTPANEALNTVELSTIDTGLAVMGILAAQSYFDNPDDPTEKEIRDIAQAIYDRVEWPFMLEPNSQQFYLGWKPNEMREGASFDIPDPFGTGNYSGELDNPYTLDFYTDEALIVILLATGAISQPVSPTVYNALIRAPSEAGVIRTFPGSLFTYEFFHAFLNTRNFLPGCPGEDQISWYENSRNAIFKAIEYVESNPRGFSTYTSTNWGISAAEGPYDAYHAYGVPPIAVNSEPEEDGTVTYYATLSPVSFGDDLHERSLAALRAAWDRGHWHPRFGLPDAFHYDISQAIPPTATVTMPLTSTMLRRSGPWVQRSLFAIDNGPMLLHLENARSGLIWSLLARNPNIQRGIQRLKGIAQLSIEGESGSGNGQIMMRQAASRVRTVLLQTGESRTFSLVSTTPGTYTFRIHYSNDTDNSDPLETVNLSVDGVNLGQFTAEDTGDDGFGWNTFSTSEPIGSMVLQPGEHQLVVSVNGGDGAGIEIDKIILDFNQHCLSLPVVLKNQ